MRKLRALFMFGFALVLLASCGGSKTTDTPKTGESTPKKPAHDTVTTASGLKYYDIKVGTGPVPQLGQTVRVHCNGTLLDGTPFFSSRELDDPVKFTIGTGMVIKGWDEGILNMHQGGIRVLIIPPELGYGARGWGTSIPPNATIVFEVELIEFAEVAPPQ